MKIKVILYLIQKSNMFKAMNFALTDWNNQKARKDQASSDQTELKTTWSIKF